VIERSFEVAVGLGEESQNGEALSDALTIVASEDEFERFPGGGGGGVDVSFASLQERECDIGGAVTGKKDEVAAPACLGQQGAGTLDVAVERQGIAEIGRQQIGEAEQPELARDLEPTLQRGDARPIVATQDRETCEIDRR